MNGLLICFIFHVVSVDIYGPSPVKHPFRGFFFCVTFVKDISQSDSRFPHVTSGTLNLREVCSLQKLNLKSSTGNFYKVCKLFILCSDKTLGTTSHSVSVYIISRICRKVAVLTGLALELIIVYKEMKLH